MTIRWGFDMTINEFAEKIKSKYPSYKDMNNTELTNKIVSKYPVYKEQIDEFKNTGILGKAKSLVGGIASGVAGSVLTAEDYLARKAVNKFGTDNMKQNLANSPTLNEQFKTQFRGNENPGIFGTSQLAGEVASLASPVGAVGKVAGGTARALGAGKNLAKVTQAGVEGLAFTAGQSLTENKKQSLKDYAINSGLNMAFPLASIGLKSVGENLPARLVNSLIKPLAKDFSYGKNPGKTVAELGIKANNFDDLISGIKAKKNEVGQNIGIAIQKASPQLQSQMDLNTLLSPLDEALNIANKSPRTNASLISRLESVKADLVDNINKGIDPQSFKGLIGDITKWTGNATDDQMVNKALKQVYGKTREGMDNILEKVLSPEEFVAYKKAADQYGNLISAENAAIYRDKIMQRHDLISFGAKNAGLITALTTAVATGGASLPTILAGLGGVVIDKAMASTAFKTRLASLLSKLAPKEIKTFFDKVPMAKSILSKQQIDSLSSKISKNIKNPQLGLSVKNVSPEAIAKKIDIEDKDIMLSFIEDKYTPELGYKAQKLADEMGIPSTGTNAQLRKQFTEILDAERRMLKRKMNIK